jgi:hypothetical protein
MKSSMTASGSSPGGSVETCVFLQSGAAIIRYPLVVEAINHLRITSIVLDGEAVCLGSDGLPDFDALWNRATIQQTLSNRHNRSC